MLIHAPSTPRAALPAPYPGHGMGDLKPDATQSVNQPYAVGVDRIVLRIGKWPH